MVLELRHIDGTIERGIHCISIEQRGSMLDLYFTYVQYIDQSPTTLYDIQSFKVWPDHAYDVVENDIREELDKLTTYHITSNSCTAMVTLASVKRVLNLVFRGHRDRYPEGGK